MLAFSACFQASSKRHHACEPKGMTFFILLLAVQIAVALFALVHESAEDPRFAGDKLGYRS